MSVLKCKMCGGDIEISADKTFGTCECCGSQMTFPKINDDQRLAMFNRGNAFRRAGEFDKALALYENIVREDDSDAEAHWCCALCRFGIEYVEDPATFEYIPTCHRASFDSFLDDIDYKAAVENADGITKRQYQKDAVKIADVQKGILATSQNEEPFDVFICYKETDDATGQRTKDSIDAQEIYYQLTDEGYRVFFSRITLEDKVGTEYEPYIFAALNSAKVMIVIGSKTEYFNAVWVKNEWSRFMAIMRKDRSKLLLPCYRNIDPYDLPEQLSVLQSYDMSRIGFIQDLIRGIKKVTAVDEPKVAVKETIVVNNNANSTVDPLLKRVFLFLEDGRWQDAGIYCEKVLDIDPQNAEAYIGKLMAELQVKNRKALADCAEPFDNRDNFAKAIRFGDEAQENEIRGYIAHIKERNETARKQKIYDNAQNEMRNAKSEEDFKSAANIFATIPGFKDADEQKKICLNKAETGRKDVAYNEATTKMRSAKSEDDFKAAASIFNTIVGFKDALKQKETCLEKAEIARKDAIYYSAGKKMTIRNISSYESAISLFETIIDWKDSCSKIDECNKTIADIKIAEEKAEAERKRKAEEARIAAEKRNAMIKKIAMIGTPIVAVVIVFLIVLNMVIIPKNKLKKAMAELDAGNYDSAYSMLAELGESDTINSSKYDRAVELMETEDTKAAYILFNQVDEYKDAKAKMSELLESEPNLIFTAASVGDKVKFGNYEQDNDTSNGKEAIEWRVLDVQEGKVLVISDKALDCVQYNTSYTDVTWETCTLRTWLNGTFYKATFSSEEQKMIQSTKVTADANSSYSTDPGNDTTDKVFLLSITEVNKYFSSDDDMICKPTDYAVSNGAYVYDSTGGCCWWLRSPGSYSSRAATVYSSGGVGSPGDFVSSILVFVRPALWIEID